MARDWQITKVHAEQGPGSAHEHISAVWVGFELSRSTVVADIRNPQGDNYYTSVTGHRAEVVVVGCPVCGFSDYIKTDADQYTTNNLLSLPRF